jgi:hypothetical protein
MEQMATPGATLLAPATLHLADVVTTDFEDLAARLGC